MLRLSLSVFRGDEPESGAPRYCDTRFRPDGSGIDALLVGYYEDKELKFAAKVRAGFTLHVRRELRLKLEPRRTSRCPFTDLPNTGSSRWGGGVTAEQMQEMVWVRPELIVQIRFVEWTVEGRLRHAAFLGARTDKSARDVRRESRGRFVAEIPRPA